MEKDVIRGKQIDKMKHIGHRIKFYRECKELHTKLFAERCGIGVVDAMDIETGRFKDINTAVLLKITEVLGIAYSDLFELDDGRYYSNIDSPEVVNYIISKAKDMHITMAYIGRTLDVPKSTYHNWKEKKRVSSPFDMQNILSLLKINADELRAALRGNRIEELNKVVEPEVTGELTWAEKPAETNMMDEVIKACEMYKNVKTMITELDGIIEKAQKLKLALGGN